LNKFFGFIAKACVGCSSIVHKMAKISRTNAVTTEGNNKIARGMLTGGRAGGDSCHALPRRTLNNLPPLFMSTKEKPVLRTRQSTFWDFDNIQCTIPQGAPEQNQKPTRGVERACRRVTLAIKRQCLRGMLVDLE
jgi:hypothetical protein